MLEFYPLKGYEGIYEITKNGCVRSLDRKVYNKRNKRYHRTKGTVLKGKILSTGYKEYTLYDNNNNKKYITAHRLVAINFLDKKTGNVVNHLDGNKLNNHVDNLEWTTHKGNVEHATKNNLNCRGEKIGNSTLKEAEVLEIIELFKTKKYNLMELGRKFNVNYTTIKRIITGENWKHVGERKYDFDIQEVIGKRKYDKKMTEEKVLKSKQLFKNGYKKTEIARIMGVTPTTIARILKE